MDIKFKPILNLLVSLTIPVILTTLTILLLLSPVFVNLEYQRPGFPEDSYGFSTEERLDYGNQTRRYLVTNQSLDVLRDLRFENGDPLYKESELTHLEDVKIVIKGLLQVFYAAAALFSLGGLIARSKHWVNDYLRSIFRGGRITTILLVTILFFTMISFRALFVVFHRIFFEGDSWLFLYSDTLIRLFPIRFWQDIFLVFGLLTLAAGGFLGWGIPAMLKSNPGKEASSP